jgi:hypothetical protein
MRILGFFKGDFALLHGFLGLIWHKDIGRFIINGACFKTGAVSSGFSIVLFGLSVYFDEEILSLVVEIRVDVLVGVREEIINPEFFDKKELSLRVEISIKIELDFVLDPEDFVLQKEVIANVIIF